MGCCFSTRGGEAKCQEEEEAVREFLSQRRNGAVRAGSEATQSIGEAQAINKVRREFLRMQLPCRAGTVPRLQDPGIR